MEITNQFTSSANTNTLMFTFLCPTQNCISIWPFFEKRVITVNGKKIMKQYIRIVVRRNDGICLSRKEDTFNVTAAISVS